MNMQTSKTYNNPVADKVDSIFIVLCERKDKSKGKIIPNKKPTQRNIPSKIKINSYIGILYPKVSTLLKKITITFKINLKISKHKKAKLIFLIMEIGK